MTKKRILLIVVIALALGGLVLAIIILGGNGKLFQGALYNIRPIYRECLIEGKNFNSNKTIDCEEFYNKFKDKAFPDGDYTVFAKYVDGRLTDNVIPLKIKGDRLQCDFLSNGYVPNFSVFTPNSELSTENIKERKEIPVGSLGLVVQLDYLKNGQNYFYDTNICESAFLGTMLDSGKKELGESRLDFNGFINSRPLVNQVFLTDKPYYGGKTGEAVKSFQAGNVYLSLNAAPDILFKFTIPCSAQKIEVQIPTLETSKDIIIPIKGLTKDYLENCGSHLYLGLQNANQYDDIQTFENLDLKLDNGVANYLLELSRINRVVNKDAVFPLIFKVNLHLRDRSDSKDVFTLGSGLLTVKSYTQKKDQQQDLSGTISDQQASSEVGSSLIKDLNATESTGTTNRPKVRRAQ
jgi:hypothetical protein